jgi:hypothetical protein
MRNPGDLPSYENALTAVGDEIQELLKQRAEIDSRLAQLKKIADAYVALMTPEPSDQISALTGIFDFSAKDMSETGISDAIRQVLRAAKVPMRPTDIKTALVAAKFDISGYTNPGTVIHSTLARLEKQNEIRSIQSSFGPSYVAVIRRTVPPPPGLDDIEENGPGRMFKKK